MISKRIQLKIQARQKHIETLEAKLSALQAQNANATKAAEKALAAEDINEAVRWGMIEGAADLEIASVQKVLDNLTSSPALTVEFVEAEWQARCSEMAKEFAPVQKKAEKAIEAMHQALEEYTREYNKLRAEMNTWGAQVEASGLTRPAGEGRPPIRAWEPKLPHTFKRPAELQKPLK